MNMRKTKVNRTIGKKIVPKQDLTIDLDKKLIGYWRIGNRSNVNKMIKVRWRITQNRSI